MTSTMTAATSLSRSEVEGRLIYAIIVAGKSARFADSACKRLWDALGELDERGAGLTPFALIRRSIAQNRLGAILRACRVGNYQKIERALGEIAGADIDLFTCKPSELEAIHGIGPKTSRFFILWTRPDEQYAVLDRHILRWLDKRYAGVPKDTPSYGQYMKWEQVFLHEARKLGVTPRELDHSIWVAASGREQLDCKHAR
jgi:hypothetical protein